MNNYRNLTEKEIATLVVYGCSADDWKNILVATDFSPKFISNVSFSGQVRLGKAIGAKARYLVEGWVNMVMLLGD